MANVFDQFDQTPQQAGGNLFDQFDAPKQADPQIGNPQELTFAEKYIAPLLPDALGNLAGGNVRGSTVGRVAQGLADPGVAIVQGAGNLIGQGDAVNQAVKDEEAKYQAARAQAGSTGFDPARLAGNVAMTSLIGAAAPSVAVGGPVTQGAAAGVGYGLLQPVTDGGNYFAEKGKQAAIGGVAGVGTSLLGSLLARVVSPNASTNADVQLLRSEGVNPTIGQTLGGPFKAMEEKATSLDPTGAIRGAQGRALTGFNKAALNRTVAPIGSAVDDIGNAGYLQAKGALSGAYQDAAGMVNHVNFDTPEFNGALGQLTDMAQGLTDPMAKKFDTTLTQTVLRKMSPNGSIAGVDLKAVDSELGQIASSYSKSSAASERELGSAVKQLQTVIRQQVASSDPEYAAAQAAADSGWRNLIAVRGATKAAINNGGVFTPGQLNMSARTVGGNAGVGGNAPMQDLATAAQNVIGNKVPNSGTVDRLTTVAALLHPMAYAPAAVGAMGVYSRPVQNALTALVAKRPEMAPVVANYLRQLVLPATAATVPMLEQGLR